MIIKIKNLRLKTIIGIYDWERNVDRDIIINAEITTNFEKALHSDAIKDAIDYDEIVAKIKNLVSNNQYNLVEKMAQDIMNLLLEDKRITKCKLEIDKVGAVESLDAFSILIEGENKNG